MRSCSVRFFDGCHSLIVGCHLLTGGLGVVTRLSILFDVLDGMFYIVWWFAYVLSVLSV